MSDKRPLSLDDVEHDARTTLDDDGLDLLELVLEGWLPVTALDALIIINYINTILLISITLCQILNPTFGIKFGIWMGGIAQCQPRRMFIDTSIYIITNMTRFACT